MSSIGCYMGAICWLLLCKKKKTHFTGAFSLFYHREDVVLLHALSQPEQMWMLQERNYPYLIKINKNHLKKTRITCHLLQGLNSSLQEKNILLALLSCLFQPYHYFTLSDIIDQPYRPVYHSEPCSNCWTLSVIKKKVQQQHVRMDRSSAETDNTAWLVQMQFIGPLNGSNSKNIWLLFKWF